MQQEIRAIIFDIIGTTSSLSFFSDHLQPYIREHFMDYVSGNEDDLKDLFDNLREQERNPDLTNREVLEVLDRSIREEDLSPAYQAFAVKLLAQAYDTGALVGHVYDDALSAFKRWKDMGIKLYPCSVDTRTAQNLLFSHTHVGDVTELFDGYFTVASGEQSSADYYAEIAREIGVSANEVLFLTDSTDDASIACRSGMNAIVLDREESLFDEKGHQVVESFDNVLASVSIEV